MVLLLKHKQYTELHNIASYSLTYHKTLLVFKTVAPKPFKACRPILTFPATLKSYSWTVFSFRTQKKKISRFCSNGSSITG